MKNSILFVIIVLIVLGVIFLFNNVEFFRDSYSLIYEGEVRHFRANLIEANKTPVFPSEDAIKNVLLSTEVFKIHIAYIPNESENSFYFASSFEITNKLGLVYRHYLRGDIGTFKDNDGSSCLIFYEDETTRCFKSVPINSTDELVPTNVEPVILLLGPSNSNKTSVLVNENLIILSGKDFSEVNRKYTDLDLAVDKMLLVLMESKD